MRRETITAIGRIGSQSAVYPPLPARGIIYLISTALGERRVEVDIESRDLAVPCDNEIHAGVLGRFAFRPRAPRQPSRIVQNLGRAMRRINIVGMRRSEIAGELVQRVG